MFEFVERITGAIVKAFWVILAGLALVEIMRGGPLGVYLAVGAALMFLLVRILKSQ